MRINATKYATNVIAAAPKIPKMGTNKILRLKFKTAAINHIVPINLVLFSKINTLPAIA